MSANFVPTAVHNQVADINWYTAEDIDAYHVPADVRYITVLREAIIRQSNIDHAVRKA